MKPLILLIITSSLFAQANLVQVAKRYTQQNLGNIDSPGIVIGVIQNDKLIYTKAFGQKDVANKLPVTKDTLFRIGSVTKTFTGMALILLRDKGLLKFDDAVEEYIPSLSKLKYPYENSPKITLEHLLTHTSGLIRHPQPNDQSIEGLINELINPTLTKSTFIKSSWYPGYKYQYSNIGIALLGEVVKKVSGISIETFIKQEILKPLGMNNTFWHESEVPSSTRSYGYKKDEANWTKLQDWDLKGYSAAGSMYSNISDMAKWVSLQFKTSPNYLPIISNPFSINEMSTPQRIFNNNDKKFGVALTWHTNETERGKYHVSHNGRTYGYRSSVVFDKEKNIGVIVMVNHSSADIASFSYGLLSKLQDTVNQEYSKKFTELQPKLLKLLQLKSIPYSEVFDKGLISIYSKVEWTNQIKSISNKYGVHEKIMGIKGISPTQSIITFKTSKGSLDYLLTLSTSEDKRLSGILTRDFTPK